MQYYLALPLLDFEIFSGST